MLHTLLDRDVSEEAARSVADSLFETSLRGVDSHGVNLFPHYVRAVDGGRIQKNPVLAYEKTKGATAVLDGGSGFGHHIGSVAMEKAVDLAKEYGVGCVGVTNSSHFGAAGYFALKAARQGFLSMAFTNADPLVKAHGSSRSFFGTNPICVCAPMKGEDPFCLDMATSQIPWNRVKNYRRWNKELDPDVAYDSAGLSVTDPNAAVSLKPVGGYKGFGLGMFVELLCSTLIGGELGTDLAPMYRTPLDSPRGVGHFFAAYDIDAFSARDVFEESLAAIAERIRALPGLSDDDELMIPGDPEKQRKAEREAGGIPMDPEIAQEFVASSGHFEFLA